MKGSAKMMRKSSWMPMKMYYTDIISQNPPLRRSQKRTLRMMRRKRKNQERIRKM